MGFIIQTRGLAKDYWLGGQAIRALNGVTMTVESGEMVAVVGPSGSGKSTLLHLLGCLDRPSAGDYWFRGRSVADLGDDELAQVRNRHIGFVFQSFNLLPRATALENAALPLLYGGAVSRERRNRAEAALARVGLGGRLHHRASTLSGGEQQRVAIARGLVNDPTLILADEPTGALDSATGREILSLLESLNAAGITVLIVTHDPAVAERARRLIRVLDGKVASDEPMTRPASAERTVQHARVPGQGVSTSSSLDTV
jgi:putative ABC transport system ATP-binding protein